MAERELAGKTAIVTGSGRNIGRAIALELAARGAAVVVNARSNAAAAEAVADEVRRLGAAAEVVVGDVTEQRTVDALAAAGLALSGGVDIAVSNAAVRPHQAFLDITPAEWDAVMVQQLTASFRLAQAVVPGMRRRRWGRLIHITGPSYFLGMPDRSHNVVAKAGLHGLTEALATELGPYGITVNDIAPGAIDTSANAASHPGARDDGDRSWAVPAIPVGRLGTPADVAFAAGFLASPRAGFFTGTVMNCFGGQWNIP